MALSRDDIIYYFLRSHTYYDGHSLRTRLLRKQISLGWRKNNLNTNEKSSRKNSVKLFCFKLDTAYNVGLSFV
jgi:hypothetical protein